MAISLIDRAEAHGDRLAVSATDGEFSYRDLLAFSARVAGGLLVGRKDLEGARVAFLVPSCFAYPAIQWGIWRAGGVAVPLCLSHPRPELEYVIDDCQAELLVASPGLSERLVPLAAERGLEVRLTDRLIGAEATELPRVEADRSAMIIYTSGTTGGPKGVVTTHANIGAQIESLVEAWEWRPRDRVLLALPLHHVHGVINVLSCALWSGAVVEMLPRFDAEEVWQRFEASPLTLFMAVPTIYSRLVKAWDAASPALRERRSASCRELRLMVSGSAALPVDLLDRWLEISGHLLLERYGMTEIGMALSNPLRGERIPGHVGTPLPGVEVRRVDADGGTLRPGDEPGEIEVRGPGVFREYWARPDETRTAFRDGWFRTGDVAVVEEGSYRLLGRQSVDIIKTGGYKVSALEIEGVLRRHPAIAECAVVGIPDEEWGERVCVAIESNPGHELSLEALRRWSRDRLAVYKIPSRLTRVECLPRNPMGKVTKPEVRALFER